MFDLILCVVFGILWVLLEQDMADSWMNLAEFLVSEAPDICKVL